MNDTIYIWVRYWDHTADAFKDWQPYRAISHTGLARETMQGLRGCGHSARADVPFRHQNGFPYDSEIRNAKISCYSNKTEYHA